MIIFEWKLMYLLSYFQVGLGWKMDSFLKLTEKIQQKSIFSWNNTRCAWRDAWITWQHTESKFLSVPSARAYEAHMRCVASTFRCWFHLFLRFFECFPSSVLYWDMRQNFTNLWCLHRHFEFHSSSPKTSMRCFALLNYMIFFTTRLKTPRKLCCLVKKQNDMTWFENITKYPLNLKHFL